MLIISHCADPDGILSAALAVRKAKKDKEDYSLMLIDYPEYDRLLEEIKNEKWGRISITDIGPNHPQKIIDALKSSKNFIIWIDHHQWDGKLQEEAGKYCNLIVQTNHCATYLYYSLFFGDPESQKLAQIAEDADFFVNKLDITPKLSNLIRYLNYKNKEKLYDLVEYFSENNELNSMWKKEIQKAEKEIEEAKKEIESRLKIKSIKGVNVGITFLNPVLDASLYGVPLMEKYNLDTGIFVYENGEVYKISIRGDYALEIARELNGGGHPKAAGGFLEKVGNENKVYELIFERIASVLEKAKIR